MAVRTAQLIDLNQPFEFEEAIFNAAEKSRIAKAFEAQQIFSESTSRVEVKTYRISPITIRLRTINNARDSMASLPDGTPLTEVSIYGSRERHHILGTYAAVKRIMGGRLPDSQTPDPSIETLRRELIRSIDHCLNTLDMYLSRVKNGERVMQIHLDFGVRTGRMVQLASEDIDFLQAACDQIGQIKLEVPPIPAPPLRPKHWWQEWTPGTSLPEVKPAFDAVPERLKMVLERLEHEVRGSTT